MFKVSWGWSWDQTSESDLYPVVSLTSLPNWCTRDPTFPAHLHTLVSSSPPQLSAEHLAPSHQLSCRTHVHLCVSPSGHRGSGPAHLGGGAPWLTHRCRALCLALSGSHRRKQKVSRGPGAGESSGDISASPSSLSHNPASV